MGCSKNIVRKTLRARTKLRTTYFIDPPEAFLNPAGFFNKIIGQNVAALKVVNGFFLPSGGVALERVCYQLGYLIYL